MEIFPSKDGVGEQISINTSNSGNEMNPWRTEN